MLNSLGNNLLGRIKPGRGEQQIKRLTRPPDMYFTYGGGMSLCCIAHEYGLLHGINSGIERQKCPKHHAGFVDNEYTKPYVHEKHLAVVKRQKPKYATVRDMMPRDMCAKTYLVYHEPQKILEWAEELREYAQHVIVIPKRLDYLEMIPEHFIVGFPMPSGYGAAAEEQIPIPPEAYKGRKIHLLGGSWARQLSYLYFFGDDVVSLDGNYIAKIAQMRQFVDPSGQTHDLGEAINFELRRALHVAFTMSCASIATGMDRICQ
jgi:hypothetical protein